MSPSRFARPPRPLRRNKVRLDTIVILPASMLPFRAEWKRLAAELEPDGALFVVPTAETPLKQTMRQVATTLRHRGHSISAVSADDVRHG